jgi:hypothetical protein
VGRLWVNLQPEAISDTTVPNMERKSDVILRNSFLRNGPSAAMPIGILLYKLIVA